MNIKTNLFLDAIIIGSFFAVEELRAEDKTRTYQSTCVKNKKGEWPVFIDGGTPAPTAITLKKIDALKKSLNPVRHQTE